MKRRITANSIRAKKSFTRTAIKTKKINLTGTTKRGGVIL